MTEFKFQVGDVVTVTTDYDDFFWVNESWKKEFRMKLVMTEDE